MPETCFPRVPSIVAISVATESTLYDLLHIIWYHLILRLFPSLSARPMIMEFTSSNKAV